MKSHNVKQAGTTLLEALIAVLVISIGLLGVASTQLYSVKTSHSSHLRTYALNQAENLIDAMRASRQGALDGELDDNCDATVVGAMPVSCATRIQWDADLITLLGPGAQGNVNWNNNNVTVTIQWNDSRGEVDNNGNAQTTLTFTTEI